MGNPFEHHEITVALLDALDRCMDMIRDSGVTKVEGNERLGADYWAARQWIDTWRDILQPEAIYPQPFVPAKCKHPDDKDWTGIYFDPEEGEERMWRACAVCGAVWDLPWPPWQPQAEKKAKKRKGKGEPVGKTSGGAALP